MKLPHKNGEELVLKNLPVAYHSPRRELAAEVARGRPIRGWHTHRNKNRKNIYPVAIIIRILLVLERVIIQKGIYIFE